MKISFYGYNSFLIETQNKKIVIDPGGGFYLFKGWLKSLVPYFPHELNDFPEENLP